MSAYLYLYCDRLIHWREYQPFYKPVDRIPHMNWYLFHGETPLSFEDMVQQQNYSYSQQRGFFTLADKPPELLWVERDGIVQVIKVMERMNSLANTHKMRYTNNSVGQALTDVLTIQEVQEYQRTKKLDDCHILKSLIETSEEKLTPDALVVKIWLQYESYRTLIAQLNRLEFEVRSLLRNREYKKADNLLQQEFEKIRR